MKRLVSICRFAPALVFLFALASCAKQPQTGKPVAAPEEASWEDGRGFDPLGLPQDSEIIPAKYPRNDVIRGRQALVDADPDEPADDSTTVIPDLKPIVDSLNNQAFRVQLMSSRVYSEARKGARVAEEIFDQPVYIDTGCIFCLLIRIPLI